jgi:hypothetical protein
VNPNFWREVLAIPSRRRRLLLGFIAFAIGMSGNEVLPNQQGERLE